MKLNYNSIYIDLKNMSEQHYASASEVAQAKTKNQNKYIN